MESVKNQVLPSQICKFYLFKSFCRLFFYIGIFVSAKKEQVICIDDDSYYTIEINLHL